MKKFIILGILFFSLILNCTVPAFCEDTTPLEYDSSSMPQGLKDLRRFEIITLGSLPFVTLDAGIVYSGIRWANNGFDPNNPPNPFATSTYSTEEQMGILLTSIGISVGIALTDYIINLIKRSNRKKREQLLNQSIIISPLSQDETATPINIDKNNEIDFTDQSSEDENQRNSVSDNEDFQDEFLNSFDDEVLEVEE